MIVVEAPYRSELWGAFLQVRREVLRWPLGLEYTDADLASETGDVCLIATEAHSSPFPLGGLLLRPHGPELKMRQVAVRADLQGRGVGRSLVEASEDYARTHNYQRIVLHARTSAVPFYLAVGYETEGDEFEEVGIPHLFMFKNLTR